MQGRKIGRFVVERALGSGGMGAVYAARDEILDRLVALKVLPAALEDDPDRRARLLREARSAAALSHPHVATVFEAGVDEGVVYLAMELVEGESLASRLSRGPLGLAEVLSLGAGIARGLACAHAAGVIHRDLKPANVMLTEGDVPKLVDFGLARAPARTERIERDSLGGGVVGTPGYMAPEQLRGESADARADLFALGVLLHEMWTGAPPFGDAGLAAMAQTLYEEAPPLDAGRAGAPPALVALVAQLLQKDRTARPASADEVIRALEALRAPSQSAPSQSDSAVREPATLDLAAQPRARDGVAPTIEVVRASRRPLATTASQPVLVGREEEVARIESALAAGARVVSVTGAPGAGKTTVVQAIADRARSRGERVTSVVLGPLGSIEEAEAALFVALRPSNGRGTLRELLAVEQGLVILDGGERTSAALVERLGPWLAGSPEIRFLLARRTELGMPPELVVELGPLPLAAAREMFLARARAVRRGLMIDEVQSAAIDEIVHAVDGNPLALSLAAARIGLLSPAQIAARLSGDAEARLALLSERRGGSSVSSLRDAIAWSFELLEPTARLVAARLSLFEGHFPVEVGEPIARLPDEAHDALESFELLRAASLLRATRGSDDLARLTMDPSVRAFARGRLAEDPRRAHVEEAFVHGMGALARAAVRGSGGEALAADQGASLHAAARRSAGSRALVVPGLWTATLLVTHAPDPELERLLRELLDLGARDTLLPTELLVRAELALSARVAERDVPGAIELARSAAARAETQDDLDLSAAALSALADRLVRAGRLDEAQEISRGLLDSARRTGRPGVEIDALERLGVVAWRRTQIDEALPSLRRALALAEALRDRPRQANILLLLGIVCVQARRFAEARGLYERARSLAQAERLPRLVAAIANNLGVIHHEEDRLGEARSSFQEAAAQSAAAGMALFCAVATGNAAMVDHESGDLGAARVGLDRAVHMLTTIGDVRFRAVLLGARAALLADEGLFADAHRDLSAAGALLSAAFEPQLALALSIRSAHVDLAASRRQTGPDAARAREAAAAHLADGAVEDGVAARSDLARMALRALARCAARADDPR